MDVHHKIGNHHMMSAHHFKSESESKLFKRQFSFLSSQRYNEVRSEPLYSCDENGEWHLQDHFGIGILPRTTRCKVCSRQLTPTRRTEMVATNNSMEFVWKNLIYYVSNQIFWNSLEDPYRHHFCTVSYGMGNAMIILYQGFGSHWGTFSWGKTEVLYCSPPPPLIWKTFLSD